MEGMTGGNQNLWERVPGGGAGSNGQSTATDRPILNVSLEGHSLLDLQVFLSVLLG